MGDIKQNEFVGYLNSLHSLTASGSNSLAESQAVSPYFGELYEPFPLVDALVAALTDRVPRVVVLTGHAGDGKSTVALDVLKRLRKMPTAAPLGRPFGEREDTEGPCGTISIVKDMSELSAERRQQWLQQAFCESGSWLVVSNTGPLLQSLIEYAKKAERAVDIETEILQQLDRPFGDSPLHGHSINSFDKELLILNLTRLDNVEIGSKLLTKLVEHSAWGDCEGCIAAQGCPVKLNRDALHAVVAMAEERVRWIYRRVIAYEQRLTLRQIVAHLAFSLTGGFGCDDAARQLGVFESDDTEGAIDGPAAVGGLERSLFSESFFGFRGGNPWPDAQNLHAVKLLRRTTFGAPVAVDFDRQVASESGIGWASLPSSLEMLSDQWRQRATGPSGVRWRFALRRMAYLFGDALPDRTEAASAFLDAFLQSPSLREFDRWQMAGKLTLTPTETSRLHASCLRVLLEVFSGFTASQFQHKHDSLYLTLRRSDQAVVQPTQLVLETLSFRTFELQFDMARRVPVLTYNRGAAKLALALPLLDYIRARDAGELGDALSPIHQTQLDWFQAELLKATASNGRNEGEIELLRSGIDGKIHLHRFLLDQDKQILEQG